MEDWCSYRFVVQTMSVDYYNSNNGFTHLFAHDLIGGHDLIYGVVM